MRISYLNGDFKSHTDCLIHIDDRGFQFADGAYEVILLENQKLIDGDLHIERLFRSLKELKINHNFSKNQLIEIQHQLFEKNSLKSGICYMQVTRGTIARTPNCPSGLKPTIVANVSPRKIFTDSEFTRGLSVMTHEDIRWHRCDIKTTNLLASTLVYQKAKDGGFDDAIFVRNGVVTEATYANVFIVEKSGKLITRQTDNLILGGITRSRIIDLLRKKGIIVEEREFMIPEMMAAQEVFLTSSSLIVRPVAFIDKNEIGDASQGRGFSIATKIKATYDEFVLSYIRTTQNAF